MKTLDQQLLAAHEIGDGRVLMELYAQAAEQADTDKARGFYLTHALVFALECGAPQVSGLRQQLIDMGRDTPV